MEFSIIIPSHNNYKYCKLTIDSIKKNSSFNHEIIVHLNGEDNETENYLINESIIHSKSYENIGLCSGVNTAYKLSSKSYILYSHDDMYFLPNWDDALVEEMNSINSNKFYLSMTQLAPMGPVKGSIQHIQFDCGDTFENFNEEKSIKDNILSPSSAVASQKSNKENITITLKLLNPTWIQIRDDLDKIIFSKLMEKDEEFSYSNTLNYSITAGNAGNILIIMDGEVLGKAGKYGEVIDTLVIQKDIIN